MTRLALYCGNVEPSMDELLSDPIIHRLMERDGVAIREIRDVMAAARRQYLNRTGWTRPVRYTAIEPMKT
jgi:hypothetical protein